ncbi:MAG: hypothetical protein CMM46_05935 [Rhodospirillaceae bacterium]|nr:hypothetical protein [Rhodospirillaceae bacterium]|tara:strand:+ start:2630 stop:2827 length:198 start_codon:yes stop_codon:yes gene_type:complete
MTDSIGLRSRNSGSKLAAVGRFARHSPLNAIALCLVAAALLLALLATLGHAFEFPFTPWEPARAD